MRITSQKRSNILGDLRAENDIPMLDLAFYETPDYRTLIESSDRVVVVGRRGSGKSALCYKLMKYWKSLEKTIIIEVSCEEDQIIGTRSSLGLFGNKFQHVRAGSRLGWRYALILEMAAQLENDYKFNRAPKAEFLKTHIRKWKGMGQGVSEKFRNLLVNNLDKEQKPEERIGNLAKNLQLTEIEEAIKEVITETEYSCVFLIDRLDEGYEPDEYGTGFVDGMVMAVLDLKSRIPNIRPTIFLRDNIFRAIAKLDPDYSRNIEGQIIILHWDEHLLFYLVCQRIRVAFNYKVENNKKLWDRCTTQELRGEEGFKKCLQLTLYRPRDVLALLNNAFLMAKRQGRDVIVGKDIEATAKLISENRLEDLHKEYSALIPGLPQITFAFANKNPELTFSSAMAILDRLFLEDKFEISIQQNLALLKDSKILLMELYRIGFIGIRDNSSGNFVFCHDGRNPKKEINDSDALLIHPCYWMALNVVRSISQDQATEIYDEYSIEISSLSQAMRIKCITELINRLDNISIGKEGSSHFEEWSLDTLKVIFAGGLRNIELRPNKNKVQKRDIVATNLSETPLWRRVREDYNTRQVLFEIKNYKDIGPDDFRQILSYLGNDYGSIGFIITRDEQYEPRKGKELDWVREMHANNGILVIKLTGKLICDLLRKIQNPQRYDIADKQINKLLDSYVRIYLPLSSKSQ